MKWTFLNSSLVAIHLFHRQPQLAQRLFPPTVFPSIARTGAENVFCLLIVKTKQDKIIGVEQLIKCWETRSTYRFRRWTLSLLLSTSKQNHKNFFQQCIFHQHPTSWQQKRSAKQGSTGDSANIFFITQIGIGSTRITILKLSFSVRLNSMDLKNTRAPSDAWCSNWSRRRVDAWC